MKRSVNFNGMKRWNGATAADMLATFRFLGMTDEEIKAKLLEMKAAQKQAKQKPNTPAPTDGRKDDGR